MDTKAADLLRRVAYQREQARMQASLCQEQGWALQAKYFEDVADLLDSLIFENALREWMKTPEPLPTDAPTEIELTVPDLEYIRTALTFYPHRMTYEIDPDDRKGVSDILKKVIFMLDAARRARESHAPPPDPVE